MSNGADNSVKQWLLDGPEGPPRLLRFRAGHASPPTIIRHYGNGNFLVHMDDDHDDDDLAAAVAAGAERVDCPPTRNRNPVCRERSRLPHVQLHPRPAEPGVQPGPHRPEGKEAQAAVCFTALPPQSKEPHHSHSPTCRGCISCMMVMIPGLVVPPCLPLMLLLPDDECAQARGPEASPRHLCGRMSGTKASDGLLAQLLPPLPLLPSIHGVLGSPSQALLLTPPGSWGNGATPSFTCFIGLFLGLPSSASDPHGRT